MFKPVSLFVGLRYTRTRKRNHIISFVSVISMLGISLGVLSLVLVLSVINGSTSTMRGETLKSVPHVTLSGEGGLTQWRNLAEEVTRHSQVLAAAPYVEGEAWLRYQGQDQVVTLRGVSPTLETSAVDVANPQFDRLLEQLQTTPNGIILGSRLAGNLGMFNGETLRITPLQSLLGLNLEDAGSFTVLGYADFGFYGNASVALVNLEAAEDFFGSSRSADIRLRLRVTDVFNAGPIAEEAVATMAIQDPGGLTITSWSESQANLFNALRMEKILTGFMLLMIVIIGAVNIVSTLVMVVADKGADIAILRTMGASRRTVMGIFVVQGFIAGIIGTVLGATLGVLLTLNISRITAAIEQLVNLTLSPDSIYMISYLQSELRWIDVLVVCFAALLISFLATLYPAWRAARVQPAAVLRYE